MLSCVRTVVCESLKLKFIILNNSSWASCASVDRIFVRMNGNIKRLVLHFRFINLFISKLLRSCSRLMVAPDELRLLWLIHRVISDRVHRLLVTLSYFRPDRFVQLLSLIPILILLLYYLVSGCLTSLC